MEKVKETTLFTSHGESIGLSMLDFWKYQYSNIFDLQENIAEFIVGKALEFTEPCNRNGWPLYDIFYRNTRIEIKETGYYYSWQKNGKISQRRTFGISTAYGADKILFGTDYPMKTPEEELKTLFGLGFSAHELDLITHLNAEKLFGINTYAVKYDFH